MSAGPACTRRRAGRPTGARDAAPRPTDVLALFFALGIGLMLAGGIAAALGDRWLALHLALLGGVSQLVLGASQFFVGAFLATDPPPRRLVALQAGLWNGGVVLVAADVPAGAAAATDAGAAVLLGALLAYAAGLRSMERRSLQRARFALRWYRAAALFLAAGLVAGALLARGGPLPPGSLLGAHLALNLGGWLGTAIMGTLHTLYPSLTGAALRFPRLERPALAGWTGGVAALALGLALDQRVLGAAGLGATCAAALMLGANVLGCRLAGRSNVALPARVVGAAQAFLPAGLLVALGGVAAGDPGAPLAEPVRAVLAGLLLAGWIGLTVLGSLVHLLAVLRRVRGGRALPGPQPGRDRALTALAVAGVALLAAGQAGAPGAIAAAGLAATAVAYVLLGAAILVLAVQGIGATRGRSPRP